MIEKGDLVIKRSKHEEKVYFVEDVNAESILLVNGVLDEYFEGEKDIKLFHKLFRLLAKAEHLIEEEKRYRLRKIPIPLLREASDQFYRKPLLPNYGPCTSNDITDSFQYQIIFTESEIAEMDITGFCKEEVN